MSSQSQKLDDNQSAGSVTENPELSKSVLLEKHVKTDLTETSALDLHPSFADLEAEIRCHLSHKPHVKGSYSALSYVWGSPTPVKFISISGRTVCISPNLFAALRRIRHETETRDLWVDALCINQDDNAEKSYQVSRMGDIYANAHLVIMWLGEAEDDSDLAMEILQRIEMYPATLLSGRDPHLKALSDIFRNKSLEQHWEAPRRVFERPYWTRAWIVQEIISAPEGQLYCGSARADCRALILLLSGSARWALRSVSGDVASIFLTGASLQIPLAEMQYRYLRGMKMSFFEGLIFLRNREATDPKDLVYSILGLVPHQGFVLDYNKTLFTIYRDVVKFLIKQDGNLDVLSGCKNISSRSSQRMIIIQSKYQLARLMKTWGLEIAASRSRTEIRQHNGEDGNLDISDQNVNDILWLIKLVKIITALRAAVSEECQYSRGEEARDSNPEISPSDEPGAILTQKIKEDPDANTGSGSSSSDILCNYNVTATSNHNNEDNQCPDHRLSSVEDSNLGIGSIFDGITEIVETNSDSDYFLPSWVPDWRVSTKYTSDHLLNKRENCYFRASGDTKPNIQFPEDEWLMKVDGFHIDTIKALSLPNRGDGINRWLQEEWRLWTEGDHPRSIYGCQTQQQEAFLYTRFTGRNGDGTKGTSGMTITLANELHGFDFVDENGNKATSIPTILPNINDWATGISIIGSFLFITTTQGFMGRVPFGAQPGDVIAIFLGGKTPYVLRKYEDEDEETYCLIGEFTFMELWKAK